ncbi:MAG: cyclase family protein [Gemmatimonadota bacterium]
MIATGPSRKLAVPGREVAALVLAAALWATPCRAQTPGMEPVDLTYAFGDSTIYWPTADGFELEVDAHGMTEGGWWYAANSFRAAEHGGTHLDAPVHFAEGGRTAAEIPLADLTGMAVVIDVSGAAAADPDHLIDVAELEAWEAANGRIPDRSIVLLETGWGERWPDPERYLGTARRGADAVAELHFPGLHPDAASWLVGERAVKAVGIDTASIDRGQSTDFAAHRVLAAANVPIFENVAHLDRVPATGSWVVALPMKIDGGTGGPLRIVAFVSGTR